MTKIKGLIFLMTMGGLFLGGCKAGKEASASTSSEPPVISTKPMMKGGQDEARAIPNATVFRMSGDYAGNVAITLNSDGSLAYYPDPIDLSLNSAPVALGNGWYLNRQGIGPDSQFTSYTFDEYRALKKVPTHRELLQAVIPGARVTDFIELPVTAQEAFANPEICLQYIK